MNYLEMIKKALNGRSVLQASKDWQMPQPTLRKYANGERLPDYETALKIAHEAGIDEGEAFRLLATEESKRRSKTTLAQSFKSLLRAANTWTKTVQMA